MDREAIKKIIPHREPMLLVDTAEVDGDGVAHGTYTVKGDEFFLQGHFPGNPVVPGVILCEIMAQTCSVILAGSADGENGADGGAAGVAAGPMTPYFTGLNNVKFREKVRPGDTLETEGRILRRRGAFCFAEAKGYVSGKLCVSAEFSFALVKGAEA